MRWREGSANRAQTQRSAARKQRRRRRAAGAVAGQEKINAPTLTTGQLFLHSCLHFLGLHLRSFVFRTGGEGQRESGSGARGGRAFIFERGRRQ